MFSYLHGIRPNNRRSANPPPTIRPQTSSSRYYHETSTSSSFNFDLPSRRTSQTVSLNQSPVSPDPPTLPPIPRVASQREPRREDGSEVEVREETSIWPDRQRTPQEESRLSAAEPMRGNNYRPSKPVKDHPHRTPMETETSKPSTSPEQLRPAPSRRKRPIDLAYESMRSYSEPPRRQPSGTYPSNPQSIPQPLRQPPPPPSKPSQFQTQPQRQAPLPPARIPLQAPPIAGQRNHGKTKLNLLNPMSLLARRRSSQAVAEAYSQNQSAPGLRLPDDYDPRIRGKGVHDFSAPRPARPLSSNESNTLGLHSKDGRILPEANQKRPLPNALSTDDTSQSSPEKEYTPVFKENFDDSIEPWSNELDNPAKERASAFMYQVSLQASKPDPNPASLPAFARNLPSNISTSNDALRKTSSPPPKAPLAVLLETPSPNQKSARSSPPTSPPSVRSRATSMNDSSFQALGSPKRYTSNSSRFSFDLAGVGSAAQEKLLEEKHRQNAKRKERESVMSDYNDMDDDDGYADYDDMMDDDGLEERIPGVNADAEDLDMPGSQQVREGFNFISPNKSSFESAASQVSTGLTSPGTPRDSQGQPVGFVISKIPLDLSRLQTQDPQNFLKADKSRRQSTPGPASDPDFRSQPLQREVASETNLAGLSRRYEDQDDDMYFDDGMIEDIDIEEPQTFDESVFDDDTSRIYGLPLRDLKPLPGPLECKEITGRQPTGPGLAGGAVDVQGQPELAPSPYDSLNDDDAAMAEMRDSVADLNQPAQATSSAQPAGLTQDNLGLHDKLAFAANQAAMEGRFNRSYSLGSAQDSHDGLDPLRGMSSNDVQPSQQMKELTFGAMGDETEDFAFDDAHIAFTEAEDEDGIIAAANAEALENDDDGFYGQEFGFYARASGAYAVEYANGGYFGPRDFESIHRMNSGRENKDPSLTPITERSEWSNRNSMISLMHGYPLSAQYASTPQLADLMQVQEGEEMSLEGLRKLRHGAWGGSNGSLKSSSNSQNSGSPLTHLPPGMLAPPMRQSNSSNGNAVSPQNLAGSFHSFASSHGHPSSNDSDTSPSGGSPTVTVSSAQTAIMIPYPMGPPPQPMGPPPPPPIDSPPVRRNAMNKPWAPGHSRNSSGAESVSYREEGGRWFLEKTRLIEETGEAEVVGRTLVEGGRI